jgi:hypothetical protein
MSTLSLIGWGFVLLGLLPLAGGYFFYRKTARFRKRAIATEGVVCELQVGETSEGEDVYHPIFRYRTREGREYTIRSNTGTNPPGFKIGQSVGIFYDPDKPSDARIDTFAQLWLVPLLLFVAGILICIVGAIVVLASIRQNRR